MNYRLFLFAGLCTALLPLARGGTAPLAPTLPPRLLVAEKSGQLMFLLPETHIGLRWQFDAYFYHVIQPAFAAASVLLSERSEEIQLEHSLRYQACADEDPSESQVDMAVNRALPEIVPHTIWGRLPPPAPVTGFSRFMRVELLIDDIYFHKYADASTTVLERQSKALPADVTEGYADHLMLASPRPNVSVDTPVSLFRAYCSQQPTVRSRLASSLLRMREANARAVSGIVASPATVRSSVMGMDKLYRALLLRNVQTLGDSVEVPSLTETQLGVESFMLVARNRSWIDRLPMLTAGQRMPFVVLGAAHFPDSAAGPGVINLLRETGYRVTLVRDSRQLSQLLALLPPASVPPPAVLQTEWKRETWRGGCTPLPHNLICGWGSERAMLQVIGSGNGQDALTLCTVHATVWGKRSDCNSFHVPAGTVAKQGGQ